MTTQHDETLARSAVYELLSAAFLYPREGFIRLMQDGVGELAPAVSGKGWPDVQEVLEELGDRIRSVTDESLTEQFVAVFGHTISTDCPPYEGEYGQAHVFQKSQTLADLATFYKAFGVEISPEFKDRPDHLSVEMEFMHLLTFKEAYARNRGHGEENVNICKKAQEGFLANHLANWIMPFARRLAEKSAGSSIYSSLAELLHVHMEREFMGHKINATIQRPANPESVSVDDQECYATPQEVGSP